MTASTLNQTKYNNVAENTVNNAVLDAAAILAWRQDVKSVVDQHAGEINGKVDKTGDNILTGDITLSGTDRTLKKDANSGRLILAGGSSAAMSNGSYIYVEGVNNGGAGLGGIINLATPLGRINIGSLGPTVSIIVRSGNPEGAVTANVGSLCVRTDGAAGTTFYVKQSGAGNTGWVAK